METREILSEYVKYFSNEAIGLTADKKTINEVTRKYNSFYSMPPMKNSALKYKVSHTTRVYIIDKKGKLIFSVDKHDQNIDFMLEKVKKLL